METKRASPTFIEAYCACDCRIEGLMSISLLPVFCDPYCSAGVHPGNTEISGPGVAPDLKDK